uniref:Peptidase S1 domain-containing protein n=1 Tax=Chelydra serpentina TaxID=8475 RepID=A0A8C3XKD6_CHESE
CWDLGTGETPGILSMPSTVAEVAELRAAVLAPKALAVLCHSQISWQFKATPHRPGTRASSRNQPVSTDGLCFGFSLECGGRPGLSKPSKIVGGLEASQGEIPWQVSLKEGSRHFCGATIIGERWLLSAAHCFNQWRDPAPCYSDPKMWVAVLGTPFLTGTDGRVEKIFRIYKHPFYNVYTLDYDVVLLELATAVRFTSAIKPICLPDNSHVFREGARCFITGWGAAKEGGMVPETQMVPCLNVIGDQACKKFYPIQISSRMVCAGFPQGTIDSCSVSTGGPGEPSGRWFLAGITSWGYGCARPYFPGVYTKVTSKNPPTLTTVTAGSPAPSRRFTPWC